MKQISLNIQGMSCSHCVASVRKELSKVASVRSVEIGTAIIEIDEQAVTPQLLRDAVETAGYALDSIPQF